MSEIGKELQHVGIDFGHRLLSGVAQLALQSGYLGKRNVVRQGIQEPARFYPVLLRVAIEVHDLVDRALVARERERGDQRADTHSGHNVELRLGQRVFGVDLLPPVEKFRPDGSPVAPARDDQDVDQPWCVLATGRTPSGLLGMASDFYISTFMLRADTGSVN